MTKNQNDLQVDSFLSSQHEELELPQKIRKSTSLMRIRSKPSVLVSALLLTVYSLTMLHGTTVRTEQPAQGETRKTSSNSPGVILALYQNSTYGVNIKYPSNWGVQTGVNSPSDTIIDVSDISPPIAMDPNAVANFQIGVENLEPNDTRNLDLYLRNAINAYRFNATDFHIDSADINAQLAGRPAYILVISDTFNGFPMKTMVMGTFDGKHESDNNGRFYYVQYTAGATRYDQLLPAVHQMINSFELA
jgi:hypothetical protein